MNDDTQIPSELVPGFKSGIETGYWAEFRAGIETGYWADSHAGIETGYQA